MRFRVEVAEAHTGHETTWQVECASAHEARQRANAAGSFVSNVEPLCDQPSLKDSRHARKSSLVRIAVVAIVGAAIAVLFLGPFPRPSYTVAESTLIEFPVVQA